ncbi:MAG: zf-HC2 domain-containing protein [Solirubrobacteraceae bacterium]
MAVAADITAARIRDGDPAALAALCERCGAAVFAYCEQVAAPGQATLAAADAFESFRIAVVAGGTLTGDEAQRLLLSMTREAAAARGVNATAARDSRLSDSCPGEEAELLDYLEDALSPATRDGVDDHLAHCRPCATALRRLRAGNRAFERPPRASLPAHVIEELLRALLRAAPLTAHGADASAAHEQALRLLTARHAPEPVADAVRVDDVEPLRKPPPRAPSSRTAPRRAPRPVTGDGPEVGRGRPAGVGRTQPASARRSAPRRNDRPLAARRPGPQRSAVLTLVAVAAGVVTLAILMMSSGPDTTSPPASSSPVYLDGRPTPTKPSNEDGN